MSAYRAEYRRVASRWEWRVVSGPFSDTVARGRKRNRIAAFRAASKALTKHRRRETHGTTPWIDIDEAAPTFTIDREGRVHYTWPDSPTGPR